jgi:hypothetical protein
MLTSVLLSLTPTTPISRRDFSSFALVVPMGDLPLLLSLQMFTRKLTRRLALLDHNGEDQLNSRLLPVLHHPLKVQERTGRADCLTSTLHHNPPIPMKPEASLSVEDLRHLCDNLALSKSSCASPITIPTEAALAVVKHLLPATNTLNHRTLLHNPSLLLLLLSDESQILIGVEQHRQHQHPHPATLTAPTVLTAWLPFDLPTALDLMAALFMTTACLHQNPHTLSTRPLLCILNILRWLLRELRMDHLDHLDRQDLLLHLRWRRLPCREWMTDHLQSAPSACESGKKNLLPKSKPVRKTEFDSMTCVIEDRLLLLVITIVVTLPKFDGLRILVDLMNRAARNLADPNQPLAMPLRAIIPQKQPTTPRATPLVQATYHQCSSHLLRCLALFTRSHQYLLHPKKIVPQVWNMLRLLLAQRPLPSLKGQQERWTLMRTTMTVGKTRRKRLLSQMALVPARQLEMPRHPLPRMLV